MVLLGRMKATIITLLVTVAVTAGYLLYTNTGQMLTLVPESSTSPFKIATDTLATTTPNPSATNQENPTLESGAFNTPLVVPNGGQLRFADGLIMTITGINDSRCPEGAQCIWAGEVGVELTIVGGALTSGEAIRLGSLTETTKKVGPYTLALITATPYTATITVSHTSSGASVMLGTLSGTVTIGPICPVEREGVPCDIPAEVYTSRNIVVYGENGMNVLKKEPLDTTGHFSISLAPGKYQLQIDPAGIGAGEKKLVTVTSGKTIVTDFDIDTGIR
jgi:hypothetical protein